MMMMAIPVSLASLGELQKLGGAFPHLAHRAGGAFQFLVVHGLDGIDDQEPGLHLPGLDQDGAQFRGRHDLQGVRGLSQPLCPHGCLGFAFFPGNIQHPGTPGRRLHGNIQGDGAFPDARGPAQKD